MSAPLFLKFDVAYYIIYEHSDRLVFVFKINMLYGRKKYKNTALHNREL